MGTATLSEILTYPIKSTVASSLSSIAIGPRGLLYDRHWAIFDKTGNLLTAREYPNLLKLVTFARDEKLDVYVDGEHQLSMPYEHEGGPQKTVDIWGVSGTGVTLGPTVNQWFSHFLGTSCEIVYLNEESSRPVHIDYGGKPGDVVSYADELPVMLLSVETVDELNEKLRSPVAIAQFRPNLVVSGVKSAAEDTWKRIKVGGCELEITKQCKRCVFATINPETRHVHKTQAPLRTLSTYRRHPEGGVAMGVYAIPRITGTISVGDTIEVLESEKDVP